MAKDRTEREELASKLLETAARGSDPLREIKQIVPGTLKGKGQKGNREWALGDGKARGSEGVG